MKLTKFWFSLLLLFAGIQFYSYGQCYDFSSDKNLISLTYIIYTWAPSSNFKAIESISYEINNASDLVFNSLKYKVTIKDPKGKVLYSKDHQFNGTIYSRGRSKKQSIFFDKPIKSNWTFDAKTHPLFFEIKSIDIDRTKSVEMIADHLRLDMKNCKNELLVNGYKVMREIYPDILNHHWEENSNTQLILEFNKEYFDDNKMQEKIKNEKRIETMRNYEKKATDYLSIKEYKLALENYLQAESLLDTTNEDERKFTSFNYKVGLMNCYSNLGEYEKAADIIIKYYSKDEEILLKAAQLYFKGNCFSKALNEYKTITDRKKQEYHSTTSQNYDTPIFSEEDWNRYKECIDNLKIIAVSETEKNTLTQAEDERSKRYESYKKIKNAKEEAILYEKKSKEVDVNASAFYTVSIFRNKELFGEFVIEIYGYPKVSKEFPEWYNHYVYYKKLNTIISRIYPNAAFTLFGISEKNKSSQEKYFSPYQPNEVLPALKNKKGLVFSLGNTGELGISFGKNYGYAWEEEGSYGNINKVIDLSKEKIVGQVVSGLEVIDKLGNIKVDKQGVYLSDKAKQEAFLDSRPQSDKELLFINIKRKIDLNVK